MELVDATPGPLLFPRGAGLIALFAGPPGTGKTLAAQAVAGSLGLDLVRVDLAAVVSKYIGETAKNLRAVFARAAHMHAVLFFDEADACFAKRTELRDAHDRHANADTSYLLTLLEEYRGVAILATNQRTSLDPAVVRRVRYVVELPRPERPERERLYRRLVAEAGGAPDDPMIDALAAAAELSGAQIRDVVITALVHARREARPLVGVDLLRGLERELHKEGRSLRPEQREKVMRVAR
ncbi:MAG: AAA family ATPase [Myxococcales bacterium]|nr:AAA family ATPase [Myxococcales bacterium]